MVKRESRLKLERCKPHKGVCHPTKCDVINDVKLFQTVYRRIYCRNFLTLSNQTSRYKCKCLRIFLLTLFAKIKVLTKVSEFTVAFELTLKRQSR